MTLEITDPVLGPIVQVDMEYGRVKHLKALVKGEIRGDPVRAMRGWILASVLEWSKKMGWRVKKRKNDPP